MSLIQLYGYFLPKVWELEWKGRGQNSSMNEMSRDTDGGRLSPELWCLCVTVMLQMTLQQPSPPLEATEDIDEVIILGGLQVLTEWL